MAEGRKRLMDAMTPVGVEVVPLKLVGNRVLAETIYSDVDLPPFSNSSMDGFAVLAADTRHSSQEKPIQLKVVGDVRAGQTSDNVLRPGQAMRIMTGAPLPMGADAVVPVEMTDFNHREPGVNPPEELRVFSPVSEGGYVRPRGEDLSSGALVLSAGRRLQPQDIGILATLGYTEVKVSCRPKVALLSTGDELLPVEADLEPGKIRESNAYTLSAQVESAGGIAVNMGIVPDDEGALRERLDQSVEEKVDLIISSAGVSVGAFDFVRSVLERYGRLGFWRVNMRPGKPLAFGGYRQVPFVGLPGNPVSAFVGFEVFVRPALMHMAGVSDWSRKSVHAELLEDIESDGRESYLRAILVTGDGRHSVRLTGHQGSGNLFSLVVANALIVIPPGVTFVSKGSEVVVWPL